MVTPTDAAMLDITIAVPTYNGAARLPKLFEHFQTQADTENIQWEILIVDNNSKDNTVAVIQQYQADWPTAVPLRYVQETRQGAAFARQKAVKEAKGRLIGFIDDDNLPAPNWVAEAVAFGDRYPNAGAFGSRIDASYEVPPPEGFEKIKAFLAIRNHGSEVIEFDPNGLRLPPAASLVIRKQAWVNCVPQQSTLSGKLPGIFIQGDDYEPLLFIHKGGWRILYDPDLRTTHQIPKERLERDYLLTLAKGCGLATCQLCLLKAQHSWHKPGLVLRTFAGSAKRLTLHILKYRRKARKDLATAAEFEFHLGSLLSPFYIRRWS
ncbi:MAG: hormogonium polysaccharide biosynthesis glycosyltransferase HpsE [Cyanobacteria bacterium P01_D01_bin.71]